MDTIKDIARKANVSVTTVSKVINNYEDISTATREKVMKIIDETNFRPNANARSLITNKSHAIGIFFKDHYNSGLQHPFFRSIIYGLEQKFCDAGYDLVLFSSKWGDNYRYLEKCRYRQVDGAILMGMPRSDKSLDDLVKSNIPTVFVDLDIIGKNATYVISDNIQGAEMAVEHLYDLGHRRIAMIMGEKMTKPAQDRLLGYQQSLNKYNLEYKQDWIVEGEFSEDGGYSSMEKILKMEKKPTAIFCQGDEIAIGAIKAIKDNNLSVPGDFSIIGFDDIEISSYIDPGLTTIHQNKFEMGLKAAELLLRIANNPRKSYSPAIMPVSLVERDSCRKIN